MELWLIEITHYVALAIEAMAMVIIGVSSVVAFVRSAEMMLNKSVTNQKE